MRGRAQCSKSPGRGARTRAGQLGLRVCVDVDRVLAASPAAGAGSAAYFLKRRPNSDSRAAARRRGTRRGRSARSQLRARFRSFHDCAPEIYFRLNPSPEGWWLAQLAIALFVMFPTTYALGWVFRFRSRCGWRRNADGRVLVGGSTLPAYHRHDPRAVGGGFLLIPLLGRDDPPRRGRGPAARSRASGPRPGCSRYRRVPTVACVALALLVVTFRPRGT